jgi:glycosyltransferase involved in cell wall biosynthesis
VKVVFLPSIEDLAGNPYWAMLRDGLRQLGVEVVQLPGFGSRWLLRHRREVDVLHFHYIQQFYAYESTHARLRWVLRFAFHLLLARALGYRTVLTLHNLQATYGLQPAWVDRLGHMCAANLCGRVIVHCEAARAPLAAQLRRRRNVYTVPHPSYVGWYPNTLTSPQARHRLGLADEHTVFLFFGGIRPNKGVEQLITAFRELPDEHVRLLIAGKPWPPREYVSTVLELANADPRVRIELGYVSDDEVQVYFNAADAVVLPFDSILTSGSAMLAMAFSRAIIVPALGCLSELVSGDIGIQYDPQEPGGLLRALQRALRADLTRLGEGARGRNQSHSKQEVAARTVGVYGTIASYQQLASRPG